MDIRVGKIEAVKRHPEADSLYVESINVGEEKPRTIVSGLVRYHTLEEMQNRLLLVICNLKPAKLRGVVSEGMVLAASRGKGTPEEMVKLVEVPSNAKVGERVTFAGFAGAPDSVVNPKKLEKIMASFGTNAEGIPGYKGVPVMTSAGICTSAVPNGHVS